MPRNGRQETKENVGRLLQAGQGIKHSAMEALSPYLRYPHDARIGQNIRTQQKLLDEKAAPTHGEVFTPDHRACRLTKDSIIN